MHRRTRRFQSRTVPRQWLALAAAFCLPAAACGQSPPGGAPAADAPAPKGDVTEGVPSAPPATPTGSVPAAKGVRVVTVLDGLDSPWAINWLPDGTALITEKGGTVRIMREGKLVGGPIAGPPGAVELGQGGLMDVVPHPGFATNGWVYFTYAVRDGRNNNTRLARAKFNGTALSDWQVLFNVQPAKTGGLHFGSRVVFLPDSTLLLCIGEGGDRRRSQDLSTHMGKVLRLTDDGKAPPDNPFVDTPNARPEIWSWGHRNPQGLARDPVTGQVWSTEHGPRGGDELNLVERGRNYGWPVVTFGTEYSGQVITSTRTKPGMENARVVWVPSLAVSGLAVYRGQRLPGWDGSVLAGGLVSGDVRRVTIRGDRAAGEESIRIGGRVRDVRVGPDGLVYVLTDQGRLARIEPLPPAGNDAPPPPPAPPAATPRR